MGKPGAIRANTKKGRSIREGWKRQAVLGGVETSDKRVYRGIRPYKHNRNFFIAVYLNYLDCFLEAAGKR